MADIQSIYNRLPANERLLVKIQGANHFFFSDDGALLISHILVGALRKFGVVHMDGRRQLAVTEYCMRSFFDAYLKGTNTLPITISSSQYPEVQVLK